MKWTRASEDNLPKYEDGKSYCVKLKNGDKAIAVRFDPDRYFDGKKRTWIIQGDNIFAEPNIVEWLDESAKSPESSVWPGEWEIREEFGKEVQRTWEGYPHFLKLDYLNAGIEGINWVKQWLQSRTAVKAEDWDLIKNFAKYFWCYETGAEWQGSDKQFNMIVDHFCADRDKPIQSQPTAGEYYAKDQMLVAFAMGYERKSKELDWSYFKPTAGGVDSQKDLLSGNIASKGYSAQTIGKSSSELPENEPYPATIRAKSEDRANDSTLKSSHVENSSENRHSGGVKEEEDNAVMIGIGTHFAGPYIPDQPSPSNPSIKRPTESEIQKEYIRWVSTKPEIKCRGSFDQIVNWLLSIQPDK